MFISGRWKFMSWVNVSIFLQQHGDCIQQGSSMECFLGLGESSRTDFINNIYHQDNWYFQCGCCLTWIQLIKSLHRIPHVTLDMHQLMMCWEMVLAIWRKYWKWQRGSVSLQGIAAPTLAPHQDSSDQGRDSIFPAMHFFYFFFPSCLAWS